jgi:hypothetical protein
MLVSKECGGTLLNLRDGDGLGLAHGDAALAAAAVVGVADDDALALFLVDFNRANADAFAADFALRFV